MLKVFRIALNVISIILSVVLIVQLLKADDDTEE